MWNVIKRTKHKPTSNGGISLEGLEKYFCAKFKDAASENETDDMSDARINVYNKFCDLSKPGLIMDEIFNEFQVRKYIKCLKSETAPGIDGIQPEHLKYSLNSNLPSLLSNLFTVCLRFGIIPDSFCKELLVPVLKKSSLDPTVPKNYRPVAVSATLSKILEYFMLDRWTSHEFSKAQFGFIKHRGTDMATALAHDIGKYCNASGSCVFYCSLDVEGAFDGLSHAVILNKAMDVYLSLIGKFYIIGITIW